tara:strand:- start:24189 stop:24806 length:618 start_codon:yes stop_codon:yes gene_type:complete
MPIVSTISFSETSKGWSSFWDYSPSFIFSLKGVYYTMYSNGMWEHYDGTTLDNRGSFYGTYYDSTVTLIMNPNESTSKNFKTVNYEGTNGWQVNSFTSDEYSPNNSVNPISIQDSTTAIKSYKEGKFISRGREVFAGFKRKENKYSANLLNNSVISREGEVRGGKSVSGIKGFYADVTLSTDSTTDIGGAKQLFSVSSEFVISAI